MAIIFNPGQVAISDPNPGGPSALSNIKYLVCKVVKLTSANFGTSAVNTNVMTIPADATIISMALWVKTQLAGNGITAATINIGASSGGTDYVSAISAFSTAGTRTTLSPITGIFQNYNLPLPPDYQIWVGGTATTGNPTSGEMYLEVTYVR